MTITNFVPERDSDKLAYQTKEDHTQAVYGQEISDYINWYIDALLDNRPGLAALYMNQIKRY